MSDVNATASPAKVPEFVYANNGAKYHPCLYCCRAFAHKRYLSLHMKACIRTHLQEDDHKPSVSIFPSFPSSPLEKEKHSETSSSSSFDITLSDEITVERRRRNRESEMIKNELADENFPEDKINGPPSKKVLCSGLSDEITIERRPRNRQSKTIKHELEGQNLPEDELDEPPLKKGKKDDSQDENGNMSKKRDSRKFSMENACKLCDEIFSSLDELIMHAKIEHNQRSKDNKKFSPEDIEYFLKVFTKMNKSHCPICRKAILNTLNWRGHLYTHCTVRKFVCKVCGKWFTRGDHCKFHEMRHKHGVENKDNDEKAE